MEEKDCRILKLNSAEEGTALQNHVIRSLMVKNDGVCLAHCYAEDNCVSYNLGPQLREETRICELSDSDYTMNPEDRAYRDGFIYQPTEVRATYLLFCNKSRGLSFNWKKVLESSYTVLLHLPKLIAFRP